MEKITILELVDFTRKDTDKRRRDFANKLKNRKKKEKENDDDNDSGGNYWVTSTSCIYNVYKYNSTEYYEEKIGELVLKFQKAEIKRTKVMHQRNIEILNNFKDFNFAEFRPSKVLKFETVQKAFKVLHVKDFPLYITPSLLFSHERNGKKELGAIWLIPKLNGFKKNEIGMFCEILYKFLLKNYSEEYQISYDFCIAIDTFNAQKVTYQELVNGDYPFLIDKTLKEIKEIK